MSNYIGKVKERITITATLKGVYRYECPSYNGWSTDYHTIYIFEDAEGNQLKWDTTGSLALDTKQEDKYGNRIYKGINEGDIISLKATVKDHKEYKGTKQTILNRVTVQSIILQAETYEEKMERLEREKAEKKQAQLDSIKGGDFIWKMPYKQYKEHYSDCETIIDSFDRTNGNSTIKVIIREGRLKNSGIRGKKFYRFTFKIDGIGVDTFKAVSLENAEKQCKKAYKGNNFTLEEIYRRW